MTSVKETESSRSHTNRSLQAERERSDEELLTRSSLLAEEADDVITKARERARAVLALARNREDGQLDATGATAAQRASVAEERRVADATLVAERKVADNERFDERERRQAALMQLLAYERAATDRTLADERHLADRSVTAREDLLAIVAHDLRNMLSTVVINASIAVMAPKLEHATSAGAKIQKIGAQMSQTLDDLLDFSSFEAGKLTIALGDVDVVPVAADAVAIHEEVATAHDIALTLRPETQSVMVRGDARRLTRLLMNVIGNALKFTPAKGRVEVRVREVDNECEIAVTDNGIGVPPEQLQTIFERFQQVGEESRRSSGVGLGLYIARLITEAHGGRIWAECEPAGGTTFRLRLPIKA